MKEPRNKLIPTLRYADARAAIRWLAEAFGFEVKLIVEGQDGIVQHSQLVGECGMIMVGSHRDDPYGEYVKTPGHTAGINTQSTYFVVADADAHHARAVAAGARVVRELSDEAHGGRAYSCLDPEGYLWNIGSYDPWAEPEASPR